MNKVSNILIIWIHTLHLDQFWIFSSELDKNEILKTYMASSAIDGPLVSSEVGLSFGDLHGAFEPMDVGLFPPLWKK